MFYNYMCTKAFQKDVYVVSKLVVSVFGMLTEINEKVYFCVLKKEILSFRKNFIYFVAIRTTGVACNLSDGLFRSVFFRICLCCLFLNPKNVLF